MSADPIQRGNSDLPGQGVWDGGYSPEATPLPGHEHQGPGTQVEPQGDPDPFLPWLTEDRTFHLAVALWAIGVALAVLL